MLQKAYVLRRAARTLRPERVYSLRRARSRPIAFSYGFMPGLTCILHSHIYIDIHNTRSADSRGQNVSVTPTASVTAATTASTAMTTAVATASATAGSAYWHGEGSLEPYVGLR